MRKNIAPPRGFLRTLLAITVCGTLVTSAPLFADVYKHVDEQGNITYSDVPQKKGDKPISMPEPMTYQPLNTPKSSSGVGAKKTTKPKTIQYDSVAIATPVNEETIRSNSGDITVQISSTPALQANNTYVVYLDGNKIQESPAATLTLTNVDRGSHTISVQIQDDKAQILASSEAVTFYLQRQVITRSRNAP